MFLKHFRKAVCGLSALGLVTTLAACKLEIPRSQNQTASEPVVAPVVYSEAGFLGEFSALSVDMNQSDSHFQSIRKLVEDDGLPKEPTKTNLAALNRFVESGTKAVASANAFMEKYTTSTLIERSDGKGTVTLSQLGVGADGNGTYLDLMEKIEDRRDSIEIQVTGATRTIQDMQDILSRQ